MLGNFAAMVASENAGVWAQATEVALPSNQTMTAGPGHVGANAVDRTSQGNCGQALASRGHLGPERLEPATQLVSVDDAATGDAMSLRSNLFATPAVWAARPPSELTGF
jgi:hypothetical protein